MRWKFARRGAMVTAAAAATLALTGGTALADSTALMFDGNDHVVSRATFITNGDNLRVCDGWPDGHSAMAVLYVEGYSKPYFARTSRGSGSCSTSYFNFVEGRSIAMVACISEGSEIIGCGPTRRGHT